MALREYIEPRPITRRHSRPKPLGGRLRLPTLRFSGAAMAMSTVVGISLATTWLLNEQQHVRRLPVMSVGASPPQPSPDADSTPTPAPSATGTPAPSASATARTQAAPALRSSRTTSTRPSPHPSAPAVQPTVEPPVGSTSPDSVQTPTTSPTTGRPPAATTRPMPPNRADHTLAGIAEVERLGRSGTRHTLFLTVRERLTALQVELRLRRPDVLPGTTPWTDLPGAVATLSLERDTLVYRFTVPAGLDIPEGRYGFAVSGSRLPETPQKLPSAVQEAWTASAFALDHPRAVATRGTFD